LDDASPVIQLGESSDVDAQEVSSFRRSQVARGRQASGIHFSRVAGLWGATGPVFLYGASWQPVINTLTTIITFLSVFMIQSSQNRDTGALQIKLDELIRIRQAHHALLSLEQLDEDDLERIRKHYVVLAKSARKTIDPIEKDACDLHNDGEGEDAHSCASD
jgi:low affinity Fe/Cu permease